MWCLHFQAAFRGRGGVDGEDGGGANGYRGRICRVWSSWRASFAGPGRWLGSSATLRMFFSSVRNGAGCSTEHRAMKTTR